MLPDSGSFVILLLQGFPSPQWLRLLGARFDIDPEFFRRHLIFSSQVRSRPSISRRTASHILPSCHGWMASLPITRVIFRSFGTEARISNSRIRMTSGIYAHLFEMVDSDYHGHTRIPRLAESILRGFSIHDRHSCSLEQSLSVGFHVIRNGWIGTFIHLHLYDANAPHALSILLLV